MIKERQIKIDKIINTIQTRISDINILYRTGPDLYFYKKMALLKCLSKKLDR